MSSSAASLSPALRDLFPRGAQVAAMRVTGDPASLLPAEARHVAKAVLTRMQEFAAGRTCGRRALAEFGYPDFAIEAAEDRQPVWPPGLIGSITHTRGFCAAVVAEKTNYAAVGIDSESADAVHPELWPRISTEAEVLWIRSLPAADQASAATLIFSAKEAFYKCQYSLTRQWLYFHDVSAHVLGWGRGNAGVVTIRPIKVSALEPHAPSPWTGRYAFHDGFVTAGIAIRQLSSPQ